ncbi:MAG TPA: DUF3501 family protein [Polyangiaceae bacterium]|nr:DUF3501 family protein [Polyangiaceae bacterium]
MKRVERGELLGLAAYEQIRERFRARIIQAKRARRMPLGPNMTVLFENRDTVLFQIQEMLRTERISVEAQIQHELETYNQLVPGADELSATVFIEYPEREERERMLQALAGVETRFYVDVNGERASGVGPKRGDREDRATAVHYLKFPLSDAQSAALRRGSGRAAIGVDHAVYSVEAELSPATLASLREDFAG